MNENNYTVYMHISPSNKRYIGITSKSVNKRWNNGLGYIKNDHFWRAIQKYGWNNFQHIIVAEKLSKQEACELEIKLIANYNTQDWEYGYNIMPGGETQILPESSRKKISEAKKGKKMSKEARAKMSESHKGKVSCLLGTTLSDETKSKISKSLKGKKHPHGATSPKQVVCEGVVFSSIEECEKHYGLRSRIIGEWLSGRQYIPEKFVNFGLSFEGVETEYEIVPDKRNKKVCYEGIIYESASRCAKYIGVDRHYIIRWLSGEYKMPDKIKAGELHYVASNRYIVKNN